MDKCSPLTSFMMPDIPISEPQYPALAAPLLQCFQILGTFWAVPTKHGSRFDFECQTRHLGSQAIVSKSLALSCVGSNISKLKRREYLPVTTIHSKFFKFAFYRTTPIHLYETRNVSHSPALGLPLPACCFDIPFECSIRFNNANGQLIPRLSVQRFRSEPHSNQESV